MEYNSAMKDRVRIETLAVHAGERRPGPEGSVVFPIFQGTVFEVPPGTPYSEIPYNRLTSAPAQRYLHDKLKALEGAEAAVATASGMAAVTTALLSLLKSGDHMLLGDCLYGATHSFVTKFADDLGWTHTFVDPQQPGTWAAAVTPKTRVFLLESITNPLIRVGKLREVVAFSKKAGLVSIIDNTFASPINFRPLSIGFDLVFHSATKYLNGHSDVVAGCVMGSEALMSGVRRALVHYGAALDPHAGYLLARGIKTMALRVKAQNENALQLAAFLEAHPAIAKVSYPGLANHPDHAYAKQLFSGFGGMLSIQLKGGIGATEKMLAALEVPAVAPSLGGVESLVTRPSTTSHSGMSAEDRAKLGITDDLVRISCGIENAQDLIDDFKQALDES
jgi:cystathionine gamma-synthase/cystathionine gamma-lyase/cystathionine beta-lyase